MLAMVYGVNDPQPPPGDAGYDTCCASILVAYACVAKGTEGLLLIDISSLSIRTRRNVSRHPRKCLHRTGTGPYVSLTASTGGRREKGPAPAPGTLNT